MVVMNVGGWSADTEMLVDSATGRLTKRCPLTTSTTTTAATCCGYSESVNGYSSTFAGENGLVGIISDVDDGLRTSSSGSVFVGPPLSVACRMDLDASAAAARRRLSDGGIHRHMAGLMDIATSDADDYLPKRAGNTVDRVTDMPPPSAPVTPQAGPGAPGRLLGGVLSQQRSASNSMLHAATSSSSRVRGAVLAKSCGDALLQRAAVGMSTSAVTSGTAGRSSSSASSTPRSRGSPACAHHHSSARVAGIRSSLSLSSSRLPDVGTGSSATRVPSYLALDDHRYTLRGPPPPNPQPPPSKIQKTGSRSSGMRQSASSGSLVGVTSILEAFLRTTRPIDPNKGSNAALAAAGLSHLPLGGNRAAATQTTAADHGVDDDASGTLLKKLLTGEIDQSSFSAAGERTSTTKTITSSAEQTATNTVTADVGCLLAEGFGFDGDLYLDDPQSMSLSLLDDVADDGLWMTAHTDDFDEKVDYSMSCVVNVGVPFLMVSSGTHSTKKTDKKKIKYLNTTLLCSTQRK